MSQDAHDRRAIEALLVAPIRVLLAAYRGAITGRLDFVDTVYADEPHDRRARHAERIVAVARLDRAIHRLLQSIDALDRADDRVQAIEVRRVLAARPPTSTPHHAADDDHLF